MPDSDLIPTGITGLDEILYGGLKQGNIMLLEGAPGTGKTTLGLEFIYRGVTEFDEVGLIVSFELSPQKLVRDAKGFGWDFAALEAEGKLKIIYTSPIVLLKELQSHDGVLVTEIARSNAKRLLIDGLTPLRIFGEFDGERPYRDSLHLLVETLQRFDLTAMLTREVPSGEGARGLDFGHEQFVCDTVVALAQNRRGRSVMRSIEVLKSRGQDFVGGKHTMRITPNDGIAVFRRAQSRLSLVDGQPTSTTRSSLGTPAVDEMIGGGVLDGSTTLVVGVSGTGKTVLGAQFLVAGAQQGKRGLMVTLDEHPAQIMRNATGLDLDLARYVDDGTIQIHYNSPVELEVDVHVEAIMRIIDEQKIERVVVDSLAAYRVNEPDDREFRDLLYALTTFLKDRLVTVVMNYESPELLGVSQISEEMKMSTIADNIILLNYIEFGNRLRRAITVPKARGSAPTRETREYTIQSGGIMLVSSEADAAEGAEAVPQLPFASYYGVLARSPARRSPLIDEVVMAGKDLSDIAPNVETEEEADAKSVGKNDPKSIARTDGDGASSHTRNDGNSHAVTTSSALLDGDGKKGHAS